MKVVAQRIYNSANFSKGLTWFKLLSFTGGAQLLVQAISFLSGILVIRLLPTKEYALYTLANTMLGTMTILADGGITTGVMAQAGKVWESREKLGVVLATGLDLRRKFAIASFLLAMPVLLYLLHLHGASWGIAILLSFSIVPAFFAALSGSILEVVPKILQHIKPLQKFQVGANSGRLVLLLLSLFIFPMAFVAIIGAGLPQLWANAKLKKLSYQHADEHQAPDPIIKAEIISVVKRLMPESIYYCVSGQITIWLVSIIGSTAAIAEIGALGRFGVIFTVISTVFSAVIIPRFTRLTESSGLLLKRYVQILAVLLLISGSAVLVTWVLSSDILLLLGKKYVGLSSELLILMIGNSISLVSGVIYFMCSSRGWVIHPVVPIVVSLVSILCGVWLLDVSSLRGILIFNIFVNIPIAITHVAYGFKKIIYNKD